jgi:hypothetical protein
MNDEYQTQQYWNNYMKKSELQKIIKEEIRKVLIKEYDDEPLNSTQNALLKDFYKVIDKHDKSLSDEEILMIISRLLDEYYENM